jgi:hypothetical protein
MPTSSPPPVPRTEAGRALRSSAHWRISSCSMSVRALDFDRRGDDVREELPREEVLLEEEALREDRPSAERLLPLADLDAPLLLEPLLLLELPVEPLFDLLLPDRAFAEDDRAPDERELLLFRDLPLDFEGMEISFFLFILVR